MLACESDMVAPKTNDGPDAEADASPLPGTPGGVFMANLRGEASITDCPNGGIEIAFGVDENLSGALDAEEVDGTEVICNGADGKNGDDAVPCATIDEMDGSYTIACPGRAPITVRDGDRMLFRLRSESSSETCPHGGVRLDVGADENQNGQLDANEVSSSELICAGEQGLQGEPCRVERQGPGMYTVLCPDAQPVTIRNGQSSAVSFQAIDPGSKCAHGGVVYQWGPDQNGNGVLEDAEILVNVALCTSPSQAMFCDRYRYACGDWPQYLPDCGDIWRSTEPGGPNQIIGPKLSCFDYALHLAEQTDDLTIKESHCRAARGEQQCIAPDSDGDGQPNESDNCPLNANPEQSDLDGDRRGDHCDGDVDGDGVRSELDCDDNNPGAGRDIEDLDCDGLEDAFDADADGDGVSEAFDCDDLRHDRGAFEIDGDCDGIPNAEDADADGDGIRFDLDCDDLSTDYGSVLDDLDCDGVLNLQDEDADGDGISEAFDCDDSRADRGARRFDLDCDGIDNASDFDRDGDGISADLDCDDLDAQETRTRRETIDGTTGCSD